MAGYKNEQRQKIVNIYLNYSTFLKNIFQANFSLNEGKFSSMKRAGFLEKLKWNDYKCICIV